MKLLISIIFSLFILTLPGTSQGEPTEKMTILPSRNFSASVSGNGRYMAFVSDRSGNYDLWIKDLLKSRFALPEQITKHPAPDSSPALNKDGTKLLYVSKKSDPRGDIYLLDRVSGVETKLTDMKTADSSPKWSKDENAFYYLKYDYRIKKKALVKYSLVTKKEVLLLKESIHSFCVLKNGKIIYSDGRKIISFSEKSILKKHQLTDGRFIDLFPSAETGTPVFFVRYSEDTNLDAHISTEDAPSIWAIAENASQKGLSALFQVTEGSSQFLYPEISRKFLYFSDLSSGNIARIDSGNFFPPYEEYKSAKILADSYRERGEEDLALMVMGNISRNGVGIKNQKKWEEFNFEFIRTLISQEKYYEAGNILESLGGLGAAGRRLKEIFTLEVNALKQLVGLSRSAKKRLAKKSVKKILLTGKEAERYVYGTALLEAGNLLISVNDQAGAIDLLNRAAKAGIKEIEARALFSRGRVYRKTGNLVTLTKIFVDIIRKFGPESFWGKKAVSDTISLSESGDTLKERLLSLRELSKKYPDLTSLKVASLFRQAYLLRGSGEELFAIDKLDRIIKDYSGLTSWVKKALVEKADIYSKRENYDAAFKTYGELLSKIGKNHPEREFFERVKLLQRVREAYRKRDAGEVKIAAKSFKMIITDHPDSVEGHRGYIESKVMLGRYKKTEKYYKEELSKNPEKAVIEYAFGLTLTYATPPKLKEAITHLEKAVNKNQSVTYFHQTLGWAYEQFEKLEKKRGYLEKAVAEYLAALELNEALQYPDVEANLLLNTGNTWFSLGNFFEALRFYKQRETLPRPFRSMITEMLFRKNLGETCFKTGDSLCAATQFKIASALLEDKKENLPLKAELFERTALSFQDLGKHPEAVRFFSQALKINLKMGRYKNVPLLRRNIGVNLYNQGLKSGKSDRSPLINALKSYLGSLSLVDKYGVNEEKKGKGLINIETALGKNSSSHARGFDKESEKKLLFGYIADTYERLSEPEEAIRYYEKKISGYPESLSPQKNAALLTEKGVTLNRLGVLYYKTGRINNAKEKLLSSLKICISLGLNHGARVNILNLSRTLSKIIEEGGGPEKLLSFFKMAREHFSRGKKGEGDFYIFSSLALLAYSAFDQLKEIEATEINESDIRQSLMNYSLLSEALYYAKKSLSDIESNKTLMQGEKNNLLLFARLNLLTILKENALSDMAKEISTEIDESLSKGRVPDAWIHWFLKAENAPEKERRELLKEAADTLLSTPLLAWRRGETEQFIPILTELKSSLSELLTEESKYTEALSYLERLEERIAASKLYAELGREIFFKGVSKEYAKELKKVLEKMRESIKAGEYEKSEEYRLAFEETIFALYDEEPSTVSLLYHYALPVSALSEAIGPDGAYLKVMESERGTHLFILADGKVDHYLSGKKNQSFTVQDKLLSKISGYSPLYLSGPADIIEKLKKALGDKSTTLVNSFYNILDARNNRTLFITKGVSTADFSLDTTLLGEEFYHAIDTVTKISGKERGLIKKSNFFVGSTPLKGGAFLTKGKNGLHDKLPLTEIAPENAHTAFLMNQPPGTRELTSVWVESLIKTGFSHVVVNNSEYDREVASKLISLYLSYLQDLPADEALSTAVMDVSEWKGTPVNVSLYGYSGMNEEEMSSLASELYLKELQNGVTHFKKREFKKALTGFENALWASVPAGKEKDSAKILKLLIDSAFNTGDYVTAIRYQKKLLSLLSPENRSKMASATYTLGILYSRIEEFDKAVTFITEAVKFWKESDELDELAKGLSTLGIVRENMGEYPKAFNRFLTSSELLGEMGESSGVADMYRKMGRINYLRLGRYEEARKNFLSAGEIYKKLNNRKGAIETSFEAGFTYEKMGLFDDADTYYKQGIEIAKEVDANRLLSRGKLYLGNTRWFRGEYQQAFQYLAEAYELAEESDTSLQVMIQNTKGLIYWTLNEPGKAIAHINKAVKMAELEKMRSEIATSLNNAGLIYRQTGRLKKSIETFKKALKTDTELKSKWGKGYDYRNLGISFMRSGKYSEAEKFLLKAEQTSRDIKNRTNQIKSLLELGNVNLLMKKPRMALDFFRSTYDASVKYHLKEVSWRAAYQEGKILENKGETYKALGRFKTAVKIVESMRAGLKIEELRNSFQENKLDLYREIILLLVKTGNTDSAFNYLERSRSRSFIDLLGNKKIKVKNSKEQKELDNLNSLFISVETVSRELGTYETPPPALLSKLAEARNIYEEALIEIKRKNPQLSSFVSVDPLEIDEFREILGKEAAALSYMVTDDEVLIWLIRREKTFFFRSRTEPFETARLVKRYRKKIQDLKPVDKELERLYEILIKPAEGSFDKESPLLIIPDGPLHYLSFSALKKDAEYLIDRTPLFYSPSASVLKFTFKKRKNISTAEVNVLAVGNPDLGSFNYDLPMAELEAASIKWNYPKVDVLTREKATKKWIVSNIGNYNVIHIASHGEFNSRTPLLSALMFASEKGDIGSLTVQEIFSLDLKADIITLSACQTGLSKLEGGELIGLNRSFIYAGTHSLISSLWRVDDLSTALLMKYFYRNFTRLDTAQSLRKAQLLVKKHFPHPAFWAGFSLVGDYKKGK